MKIIYDWRIYACFSIPIIFSVWWIWARLGQDKRWFVAPMPFISNLAYFALPTATLGLFFMAIQVTLIILDPRGNDIPVFVFLAFGLWGVSYIIAFLEPNWMAPDWYRWLKKEHGDIMPYLVRDAQRLGREAWMERVKTQEGLEEWAAEVQRKHGL